MRRPVCCCSVWRRRTLTIGCRQREKASNLTPTQLRRLQTWINAGAIAPEDEPIPTDPHEHWAYQPPKRAAVPQIKNAESQFNPIDAFIAQQHRESGIIPAEVADNQTLVRRLYFDLIGLPPTRQQIDDFVNDDSAGAYARLVNNLLNSPQYGERWGRHWMDVWRYSDWNGYKDQLRGSQRHIWRWRDWIIESLNADKGYDQMIIEMLAGDEAAPDDLDVLRATGFLARNFHKSNRNIWLDATVEHTAKAFLGMTINCAKCHDHKFDPIAQTEYYAMRAIFEPHNVRTERIAGQRNVSQDGVPRAFDAAPDAKTFLYVRGNEKHFDKESPVAAAIPAVFNEPLDIQPVPLPPIACFQLCGRKSKRKTLHMRSNKWRRQEATRQTSKGYPKRLGFNPPRYVEAGIRHRESRVARCPLGRRQGQVFQRSPSDLNRLTKAAAESRASVHDRSGADGPGRQTGDSGGRRSEQGSRCCEEDSRHQESKERSRRRDEATRQSRVRRVSRNTTITPRSAKRIHAVSTGAGLHWPTGSPVQRIR